MSARRGISNVIVVPMLIAMGVALSFLLLDTFLGSYGVSSGVGGIVLADKPHLVLNSSDTKIGGVDVYARLVYQYLGGDERLLTYLQASFIVKGTGSYMVLDCYYNSSTPGYMPLNVEKGKVVEVYAFCGSYFPYDLPPGVTLENLLDDAIFLFSKVMIPKKTPPPTTTVDCVNNCNPAACCISGNVHPCCGGFIIT